ncbi:MAG: helix-turn-helix domain-containing protein [Halanaerobacter sp.]
MEFPCYILDDLGKKNISDRVLQVLQSYSWPGNVRELQNIIQRGIVLSEGEEKITIDELPEKVKHGSALGENEDYKVPLMSLKEVEKKLIKDTLAETGNNISQAAKLLDIGRSTLYRKINKYDLK